MLLPLLRIVSAAAHHLPLPVTQETGIATQLCQTLAHPHLPEHIVLANLVSILPNAIIRRRLLLQESHPMEYCHAPIYRLVNNMLCLTTYKVLKFPQIYEHLLSISCQVTEIYDHIFSF